MALNPKYAQIAQIGFQNKCLIVLIDSYRVMKQENNYSVSWKENALTKLLLSIMKKHDICSEWQLEIFREYILDDYYEDMDADETPRIDIRFSRWQNQQHFEYFIEAKNLCETDWTKEQSQGGGTVSSSYQLNRFVNEGISHFISGYYPSNGCMCGYLLQGNPKAIITKLDAVLSKKSLPTLKPKEPFAEHNLLYEFIYQNHTLINIFLDFQ